MRLAMNDWVFDSDTREVIRKGRPVPLSPKAFALLEHEGDNPANERLSEARLVRVADGQVTFTVKALNPTTMATYGSLELQTDYTV